MLEHSRSNSNKNVQTNGDILNFDLGPSKVGQIKNLGIMSCIPIRYTYDNNLEMIQPLVQEK
jgi:hypothetical protein